MDAQVCADAGLLTLTRRSCPVGTQALGSAGPMLLEAGKRRPLLARDATQQPDAQGVARYYSEPQPRSAIGVDERSGRIWWLVVDGRQPGYSEGISLPELATLFLELGATHALNLDGGGSSTLVVEGQVMNSPIHTAIPGRERPVANHIGLRLKQP